MGPGDKPDDPPAPRRAQAIYPPPSAFARRRLLSYLIWQGEGLASAPCDMARTGSLSHPLLHPDRPKLRGDK